MFEYQNNIQYLQVYSRVVIRYHSHECITYTDGMMGKK